MLTQRSDWFGMPAFSSVRNRPSGVSDAALLVIMLRA